MTNTLAILLGLFIVGGICADVFLFESENIVFLVKKLADLIEWMAFWR